MLETEDDMARWLTAIRWRVDFFMSDRIPSSSPTGAQDIPGSRSPPGSVKDDKQLFSISNSERQNQGFLKGFYSMKNRGSVSSGTSVTGQSVPSSGIVSPRGISSSDGAAPSVEINFGPTQTSPTRRETPSPNTTSPTASGSSTPKPRTPSPPPVAVEEAPKVQNVVPVLSPQPLEPARVQTPPPQQTATAVSPVAVAPSETSTVSLEDRIRILEAENQLLRQSDVGSMRQQFLERENELKKAMAELTSSTESKKRSFTLIVASKDDEIAKLRREAQQATTKKTQELEEKLAQRDKELAELKAQRDREVLELQQKLSDKELEVLELREREFSSKSKADQQNQEALMTAIKKQRETEELLNKVKDRFFFSLAMNFKLQTRAASAMDLNSLYERVKKEQVPYDKWQEWLSLRVKEITGGVGEDPEDARGF
eukprot:TRINITY_DN510_c0_g1_i1.p1 TRINITY_DN510_c0_g1~~TRINITY_DN510_c0_g1_i1.p1  ORF type:complete len:428 (-),score=96.58 TRINITY_DN510_c0_g1_i1:38-1321(-)